MPQRVHVYLYVCVYLSIYIYVHIRIHIYVHMYVYVTIPRRYMGASKSQGAPIENPNCRALVFEGTHVYLGVKGLTYHDSGAFVPEWYLEALGWVFQKLWVHQYVGLLG